jgi:hypothetical protein
MKIEDCWRKEFRVVCTVFKVWLEDVSIWIMKKAAHLTASGFEGGEAPPWGVLSYRSAAERSAAALSVRSQVKSGSSRPKWP